MKIKWLGQSGYLLSDCKTEICIDPYLSDSVNRIAGRRRMFPPPILPQEVKSDIIICTHNHLDHLDPDTISNINHEGKIFFAPTDCMEHLERLGVKNKFPFNEGNKFKAGSFEIEAVFAYHTIPATGVVVRHGGKTLYFTGDTYYHEKLEALKNYAIDYMFVCINGKLGNMNVKEAVRLTEVINPHIGVPNHYGMFESNTEDPEKYTSEIIKSLVMEEGIDYDI